MRNPLVTVIVPASVARRLAESDDGFDGTRGPLVILVEKDWQCLAPRDDADAFPHPGAKSSPGDDGVGPQK